MPNNYSETSFDLPNSWPFKAKKEFVLLCLHNGASFERSHWCKEPSKFFDENSKEDTDTANEPEETGDLTVEEVREQDPLWFGDQWTPIGGTVYEDEYGAIGWYEEDTVEEAALEALLVHIVKKYRIRRKDAVKYEVAYTCSKPVSGQFGGSSTIIYDETTQPFHPGKGFLETPVSWDKKLLTMFKDLLTHLKYGDAVLLGRPSKLIDSMQGHIYPEMKIEILDDYILRVEDLEWFSPELMDEALRVVFEIYAERTGRWPVTPVMVSWSAGSTAEIRHARQPTHAEGVRAEKLHKEWIQKKREELNEQE